MKESMVWLVAFLAFLMFSAAALAVSAPPQSAGDVPVPAHTVPVVTNMQVSGTTITVDVSGTYTYGSAVIHITTSSGTSSFSIALAVAGSGLSGSIAVLPPGTLSWRVDSVTVINTSTPNIYMSFNYNAAGALASYGITDSTSPGILAMYNYDGEGRLTSFSTDNTNASYGLDGSLTQYSIITPTGFEQYNAQNQLILEQITDPATGIMTRRNYEDGVLKFTSIRNPDGSQYMYDGQGVLRESITIGGVGTLTINLYDPAGNLYSYATQSPTGLEQYDTEGNLIRRITFDGPFAIFETYTDGQLTQNAVNGLLPDGREYNDIYKNGVYTQRIVFEGNVAYYYDADGNYTGKAVYDGPAFPEADIMGFVTAYQEFNAAGDITKYRVFSEQQGGVWLTYNYRHVLQSLTYVDPYLGDVFRYDAKNKVWYLNEVPYDGPVPIALSQLKLEQAIVWYPNNTVCSFGPQFRDVKPSLTDKWYMFTPVDVSHDGTQTFELVGGSVYVLGQVSVTVSGDSVTVNYKTVKGKHGNVYTKSEYLNFFPDLASVTTVNPEELGEGFRFGKTISIQKDLGGDTNVLMFVRNVATFCNFADSDTLLRRFFKNLPGRVDLRNAMLALMD